jgi:hypothetical protein
MKEKIENIIKSDKHKIQEKLHLDKCVSAAHPEMVRNNDDDEPCDDGRS